MNCSSCQKPGKQIHSPSRSLCFYCFTQENNRKALDRTVVGFKSASAYNLKLFTLYIEQVRRSYVKNSELPVARKWAQALSMEKLPELRSWTEVRNLSERLSIRHGKSKTCGCPVMKTARILASLGELPPINSDGEIKFRPILAQFPEPLKSQVDAFRVEIGSRHMKSFSSIKILRGIARYYKFLAVKKNFWLSEVETAQGFLDQLPSMGVCDYSEHLNALKRFFNWGMSQGLAESNPFLRIAPKRLIRICAICKKEKIFRIHDTFCSECDVDRRYCAKIEVQKAIFIPKSPYNQMIYDLYLKYINRFMLQPKHYRATLKLQKFLSETEVSPFKSWTEVTLLSRQFKSVHGNTRGGCPIEKIGRMLQELSVLSIREEDPEIYLLREISEWELRDRNLAKRYVRALRKQGRTVGSANYTLKIIRSFAEWLRQENREAHLFTAQESMAIDYCEQKLGVARLEVHIGVLGKFYRWAMREKLTLINPVERIRPSKKKLSLQICDDRQIRQFEKFVKSKDSDPELALIMALVLYWGFTAKNIAWSTLEISEVGQLKIILHRESLSYRNKEYRRAQTLLLPMEPKWLFDLQKRYVRRWQTQYEAVRKNFPLRPLILHKQGLHNRPLRTLAIQKRFEKATHLATGMFVPMNVVRRTCGHIYSIQGDAAILAEMGWSKDYSFDFMWRPRLLFTGNKK